MPAGRPVTVARVEDLPPGAVRTVQVGELELALAHVDGRFVAARSTCPHLGGPLGEGRLEGSVLSCPWHGWQFDITTCENEFDRAITLDCYETIVEDGEVKVVI